MDQASVSKLTNTQSVIRNKFAKAYTNRLEHEHDVKQAMQPLVRKSAKHVDSENDGKKPVDLNELCNQSYNKELFCSSHHL